MAENVDIYNSDGQKVVTVEPNTIDTTFDVSLIGEGVEDYLQFIDEDFVHLLENFAGDEAPEKGSTSAGRVIGQIWYDTSTNEVKFMNTTGDWESNAVKLEGKTVDAIREYVLSGLDTSGKLSKDGGTITGEMKINGAIQIKKTILPTDTDNSNLGGPNSRFRNIYLAEDGIRLGVESSNLTFKPHNFVYVVQSDDDDVSKFPIGAIILHQETGEAILKKTTGHFDSKNSTFRKLADDKQNSAIVGGNKFNFMGDIGLIAGGWGSRGGHQNALIEKITISTTSNATKFGNLSYGRSHMGVGMSSGSRGVFHGGWNGRHGTHNGNMDYVRFATPSNATYFGTFGQENYGASCVSDGTRGVIGPGYNRTSTGRRGHHYMSKYITIETPSNASTFGTIKSAYWGSAVSSGTRGVFGGYTRHGWASRLEYITIQKPGNSIYFGNTKVERGPSPNTVTDMIKGVYMGGWNGRWNVSKIEYITIATPGNAVYFGNMRRSTGVGVGLSNGIRGVSASSWWNNVMDYITIATPGNARFFGNMSIRRGARPSSASGN